jgi:hypothetical protein
MVRYHFFYVRLRKCAAISNLSVRYALFHYSKAEASAIAILFLQATIQHT